MRAQVAPITDEELARLEAQIEASAPTATIRQTKGPLVAALREARRDYAADHAQLMAISGALCDAGDVVVEPYADAVRELVRQRDEAKAWLLMRIDEAEVRGRADERADVVRHLWAEYSHPFACQSGIDTLAREIEQGAHVTGAKGKAE